MQDHEFKFQISTIFRASIGVAFLLGMMALLYSTLNWLVQLPLLMVMSFYLSTIYYRYVLLRRPHSVRAIRHKADNIWLIQTNSHSYEAIICGDSLVTRWICALQWKIPNRYTSINSVIFCDALSQEDYRQLLVCLKTCGA